MFFTFKIFACWGNSELRLVANLTTWQMNIWKRVKLAKIVKSRANNLRSIFLHAHFCNI